MNTQKKIPVTVTGLPGAMATMIMTALKSSKAFEVLPFSLTGPEVSEESMEFKGVTIDLITPARRRELVFMQMIVADLPSFIAIDFTQPSAVEKNVNFYCDNGIPFVMGTTGGNRDLLPQLVESSKISAVIAPNMSVPIVMLMDMIAFAAENYPNILKDWKIRIVESHQSSKKDVSGTAMAIGKIMKNIGVNYTGPENIRAVRDKIEQRLMGIPEFALDGHGWHKYSLISPDGKVVLGFEHNISGRNTYVNGTLMALDFLAKKVAKGVQGKCFSMKDVMRG